MQIALATPNLTDGDGVGNDVLGMAHALRASGHGVQFYADTARVAEDVRPLAELDAARADRLIYHHSIRCDAGVRAVEAFGHRAAVKYHNITPPHFFDGWNADARAEAEAGLRQATRLAKGRAAMWVDSPYNARDLGRACEALPPFHQAGRLHAAEPDARAVAGLDGWGSVILCVGRVAPNKNLLRAAEAFADFRANYDPAARLVVAGEHVFQPYSECFAARVHELGIADAVSVTGRVTLGQLKALYLTCDALLVTSDHEGFGVPVVEAMALGVPVVAVPRTAVPETGGDAVQYAEPGELAEAMAEVIQDAACREAKLLAGRERYATHFAGEVIASRFTALFASQ